MASQMKVGPGSGSDAAARCLPERQESPELVVVGCESQEDGAETLTSQASLPLCNVPGNVAVNAERDVHCHIGQEVKVDYNVSNVHNSADHMVTCHKFVSKSYNVSHTYTGDTPTFSSIRDQTRAELAEDQQRYVETAAYHQALTAVVSEGAVLITGPPGSGMAATARAVLRYLQGEGYTPLILHDMKEWRQHAGGERPLVVLLQHVFGEMFLHNESFQEGARCFRSMLQLARSQKCLLIFTAYPNIAQEMKDFEVTDNLFRLIPVVNLFHSVLSNEEKEEMMRRRSVSCGGELVRLIVSGDLSGCVFPWCLRRFQQSTATHASVAIFTKPALSYIPLLLRNLKHEMHGSCLAAALLLLAMGVHPESDSWDWRQDSVRRFGVEVCRPQCVRATMRNVTQLFGRSNQNQNHCCAGHDGQMAEVAAVTLASSHFSDSFVHNCQLASLMDLAVNGTLTMGSSNYDVLHRRVYDAIMTGHLQDISQHQLLHSPQYLEDLVRFCLQRALPIHNLFSVTDPRHREPLLYWSAFSPSCQLTVWCVQQMLACGAEVDQLSLCLQRVLMVTVLIGDHPTSPKVRSIIAEMSRLPEVTVPAKKMTLPFPKHAPQFAEGCEFMKKHGGFLLHTVLSDGFFPYDGVRVFINEVRGYFKLEMTQFHWSLVLRRVGEGQAMGLHQQDAQGNTFLHLAARHTHVAAVRFAVRRGASLTVRNSDGLSPPDLAAKNRQGAMTPGTHRELHIACQDGNVTQVKKLLCLDASVRCRGEGGVTALHVACRAGQISIASLLLQLGADINTQTDDGLTALTLAVKQTLRKTTEFLLEEGANPNTADVDGWTALHWATATSQRFIVMLLLRSEADINKKTRTGDTPLHLACQWGDTRTTRQLVEQGARLNLKNRAGMTGLHLAVQGGFASVVQLLGWAGASMSIRDKAGSTPLDTARVLNNGAIYALLLQLKAEGSVECREQSSCPSAEESGSSAVCAVAQVGTVFSDENEGNGHTAANAQSYTTADTAGTQSESANSCPPVTQQETVSIQSSVDVDSMFGVGNLGIRSSIRVDRAAVKMEQRRADKRSRLHRSLDLSSNMPWLKILFVIILILCILHTCT